MRNWEVNLGLTLGGVVRALAIGAGLLAAAAPVTGVPCTSRWSWRSR